MFGENYKNLFSQVKPDEPLVDSVLQTARNKAGNRKNPLYYFRKPALAFVLICICLSFAMPALAANVEPIYRLMYMVSPQIAQFFMPVQKSDVDNGIKMEVVSAYIHGNVAEVYVTMQDITEKNRVDATTDLFDSYSINRPFDSAARCDRVGYDDSTKTATFLITIEEWNNKKIVGDKITFSVREFLSHKKNFKDIPVPIDLSTVDVAESTQAVSSNGGGGIDYKEFMSFNENPVALIPSAPISEFSVDGINLTGIGYIDGRLHIQTAVKEPLDNDNHGFFYLKDSNGNRVDCNYNFYFSNQYEQPGRIDYCNYVFDIPQGAISSYTLHGDFVTSGMKVEGNWRVTFPLEDVKN